MVAVLPFSPLNDGHVVGEFSQATTYFVVKDPAGLKVLWTRIVPVSSATMDAHPNTFEPVMDELGKRLKARARK